MIYLKVPSMVTMFSIVFIFSFSFYTPLHISALMGHLLVEYTQSLMEDITPKTDPFLGYTIYTYSFILLCYTLFLYLKLNLFYVNVCCTHKTVILSVVLYGCKPWSLILREEHRLRVSENRVLRRIFGPKRHEVTGGWRKLHN
jgi:hypothetical protein